MANDPVSTSSCCLLMFNKDTKHDSSQTPAIYTFSHLRNCKDKVKTHHSSFQQPTGHQLPHRIANCRDLLQRTFLNFLSTLSTQSKLSGPKRDEKMYNIDHHGNFQKNPISSQPTTVSENKSRGRSRKNGVLPPNQHIVPIPRPLDQLQRCRTSIKELSISLGLARPLNSQQDAPMHIVPKIITTPCGDLPKRCKKKCLFSNSIAICNRKPDPGSLMKGLEFCYANTDNILVAYLHWKSTYTTQELCSKTI